MWAPGGQVRGVVQFTIDGDRIVAIDVTGDDERIRELDIVTLDADRLLRSRDACHIFALGMRHRGEHHDAQPSKENTMEQFALMIYQGTTPLPGTDEWEALPEGGADPGLRRLRSTEPDPRRHARSPARAAPRRAHGRVKDGTDGTYARAPRRTDGAVGGFLVFEADDIDAAIELAARIPAARLGGAIEIRPMAKYW